MAYTVIAGICLAVIAGCGGSGDGPKPPGSGGRPGSGSNPTQPPGSGRPGVATAIVRVDWGGRRGRDAAAFMPKEATKVIVYPMKDWTGNRGPSADDVHGDPGGTEIERKPGETVVEEKLYLEAGPQVDFYAVAVDGSNKVWAWGHDLTMHPLVANTEFSVAIELDANRENQPLSSLPQDRPPGLTGITPNYCEARGTDPYGDYGAPADVTLKGRCLHKDLKFQLKRGEQSFSGAPGEGTNRELHCVFEPKDLGESGWWDVIADGPGDCTVKLTGRQGLYIFHDRGPVIDSVSPAEYRLVHMGPERPPDLKDVRLGLTIRGTGFGDEVTVQVSGTGAFFERWVDREPPSDPTQVICEIREGWVPVCPGPCSVTVSNSRQPGEPVARSAALDDCLCLLAAQPMIFGIYLCEGPYSCYEVTELGNDGPAQVVLCGAFEREDCQPLTDAATSKERVAQFAWWSLHLRCEGEPDIQGTYAGTAEVQGWSDPMPAYRLDLTGVTPGKKWDYVMEGPDEARGVLEDGLLITEAVAVPFAVTGIEPDSVTFEFEKREQTQAVTVSGTRFLPGATVRLVQGALAHPDAAIDPSDVTVLHSRQINCTLNLTRDSIGVWDLWVGNPKPGVPDPDPTKLDDWDDWNDLPAAFTVRSPFPEPTLTGIDPNAGTNDGPVDVELSGTGFLDLKDESGRILTKASLIFPDPVGDDEDTIPALDLRVESSNLIACRFDLTNAQPGDWDVEIVNPDGQSRQLGGAFTVVAAGPPPPAPAPIVSAIDPRGARVGTLVNARLSGRLFQDGAQARLERGNDTIPGANELVELWNTRITCTFDLTGAAEGAWDVVVENPDAEVGVLPGGFTVYPAAGPEWEIEEWRVCATHGDRGQVATPVSDGYIEPRDCGIATLEVVFSEPIDERSLFDAQGRPTALTVVSAKAGDEPCVQRLILTNGGRVLRVPFSSALRKKDMYTMTVADTVTTMAGSGPAPTGDRDCQMGVLKGDVNGDRAVSEADLADLRPHIDEVVGASNARYDVNLSGTVNTLDLMAVQNEMGRTLAQARGPLQRAADFASQCGRHGVRFAGAVRDAAERGVDFVRGSWSRGVEAVRDALS